MRAGVMVAICVALLSDTGFVLAQSRDITVEAMTAENRLALVIGNGSYAIGPLRNPVNDARAMTQTLRDLGFEVMLRENANEREMKRAISEFGDRLGRGGVGLFFYAGHGVRVGARNYLIPIGADVRHETDVDVEAIDVNRVLSRMGGSRKRLNIVILDACRNNPFERAFRSTSDGLTYINGPLGTLIAYATEPGRVAQDGTGSNGVYTSALVRAMREPGLPLEEMFKRVRAVVRQQTRGEQIPWESSSVEGQFMFALPKVIVPPPPRVIVPLPPRVNEEQPPYPAMARPSWCPEPVPWNGEWCGQPQVTSVPPNDVTPAERVTGAKGAYPAQTRPSWCPEPVPWNGEWCGRPQ